MTAVVITALKHKIRKKTMLQYQTKNENNNKNPQWCQGNKENGYKISDLVVKHPKQIHKDALYHSLSL